MQNVSWIISKDDCPLQKNIKLVF